MAITRLSVDGYGARRTGSFSGKEQTEVVVVEEATQAKGGFGLPTIVKPIKRHKKLETFREELERLVFGVQEAAKEATEEVQPVIEKAAKEVDSIAERFNIVQTFDDQALISGQMEMLRQDFEEATKLLQTILARKKRIFIDPEEELIILLAAEVL